MKQVSLANSFHNFQKKNLVSGKNGWDTYVCSFCGLTGVRKGFVEHLSVPDKTSDKKIEYCSKDKKSIKRPAIIQITLCTAQGHPFANLTPGSKHRTVNPPFPYEEDTKGVWVEGIGEPVKVLNNEFIVSKVTRGGK